MKFVTHSILIATACLGLSWHSQLLAAERLDCRASHRHACSEGACESEATDAFSLRLESGLATAGIFSLNIQSRIRAVADASKSVPPSLAFVIHGRPQGASEETVPELISVVIDLRRMDFRALHQEHLYTGRCNRGDSREPDATKKP